MDTTQRIGQRIGNYRLVSAINSGSFGSIYCADHVHLKERVVAIKLPHT